MKKYPLLIAFLMVSTLAYCKSETHTVYSGLNQYVSSAFKGFIDADDDIWIDGLSIGYRYVACPNIFGFYYGGDTSFALGQNGCYFEANIPFGYRWSGGNTKMGIYFGGGPIVRYANDIAGNSIIDIGPSIELGWQTNKSDRIGFHLGFVLGIDIVAYYSMNNSVEWFNGNYSTQIQLGMSWRRVKD